MVLKFPSFMRAEPSPSRTSTGFASAARRLVRESAFDLVVLDIMMPGEDGLSLCRWLGETHEVPIVLLTAVADETDRIIGLEMGADDYVTKPFSPKELAARIRAVFRRTTDGWRGQEAPNSST